MRRYSYNCEACGWERCRYFEKGTEPQTILCENCGERADRVIRIGGTPSSSGWPLISEAAGVHPNQIKAARESDIKNGVPCDFTSDGRRIFNDRAHRRDWLRSVGLVDRSGGYGDG